MSGYLIAQWLRMWILCSLLGAFVRHFLCTNQNFYYVIGLLDYVRSQVHNIETIEFTQRATPTRSRAPEASIALNPGTTELAPLEDPV